MTTEAACAKAILHNAGGYVVAGPNRDGRMESDWDGDVHSTVEAGRRALGDCRAAGYEDWNLYALVPDGWTVAQ